MNSLSLADNSDRDDPRPRACFANCNYNLYVMNADGSDVRQLTDNVAQKYGPEVADLLIKDYVRVCP